jgi:hypothetical protein
MHLWLSSFQHPFCSVKEVEGEGEKKVWQKWKLDSVIKREGCGFEYFMPSVKVAVKFRARISATDGNESLKLWEKSQSFPPFRWETMKKVWWHLNGIILLDYHVSNGKVSNLRGGNSFSILQSSPTIRLGTKCEQKKLLQTFQQFRLSFPARLSYSNF